MPQSYYEPDDGYGSSTPMFRTVSSIRGTPAPRQIDWTAADPFDDLNVDSHPAFIETDGWGAVPDRSLLAINAPRPPLSTGHSTVMPREDVLLEQSDSKPRRADSRESSPFPSNPKTPYEVLGISPNATQEEVKKAYKKRALRYHPDTCRGGTGEVDQATKRFQLIAEAFAILGDGKPTVFLSL